MSEEKVRQRSGTSWLKSHVVLLCCCVVPVVVAVVVNQQDPTGSRKLHRLIVIFFSLFLSLSLSAHCQILAWCGSRTHSSFLSKSKGEQSCSLLLFLFCPPFYFSVAPECLMAPYYTPDTTRSDSLKIQIYWTGCRRMTGIKKNCSC